MAQLHLPDVHVIAWRFQLADKLGEEIKVVSIAQGGALNIGAVS